VAITDDAKQLITTLNEEIIVTEFDSGKQLHELEGVRQLVLSVSTVTYIYSI
jgi:U3 small nucleolar RNA-associated protein 13